MMTVMKQHSSARLLVVALVALLPMLSWAFFHAGTSSKQFADSGGSQLTFVSILCLLVYGTCSAQSDGAPSHVEESKVC